MTITNNIYQQIYALNQMDTNIAVVGEEFFTYLIFEPSMSANTSSIDFVTLRGICITEFINQEKINEVSKSPLFYQQFQKFIEPLEPVTIKFNKVMPYYLFSK